MKIEQKEKEFRRIILRRRDRLALLSHENITPSTLISFLNFRVNTARARRILKSGI